MAREINKKLHQKFGKYLPYVRVWIDLPLVEVRTNILCYADFGRTWEYIMFHVRIWKWRCEFSIYDIF